MITGKDKKERDRIFTGHSANEENAVQGYLKEIFQFGKHVFDHLEQGEEISSNDMQLLRAIANAAKLAYDAGLEQQHPLQNGDTMYYVNRGVDGVSPFYEERSASKALRTSQGETVKSYVEEKFKEYDKILRERNREFPKALRANIYDILGSPHRGYEYSYLRAGRNLKRDYYLIQALDQLILEDDRDNEQVVLNLEKAIPDAYKREKFVLDIAPLVTNGNDFVYTAYPERKILDKYTKGKALTRQEEIDVLIDIVNTQAKKLGLGKYNAYEVIDSLKAPESKTTKPSSRDM